MQKKIIALAVAGLMSGAAFAQSNVTISGNIYMGYDSNQSNITAGNGTVNRITDHSSNINFAGTEDLGGGMKAIFVIDSRFGMETTGGTWAGGNSHLGLTGNWGAVRMGKQDLHYNELAGGIGSMRVRSLQSLLGHGIMSEVNGVGITPRTRANNVVWYTSPTMSGFTVSVAGSTAAFAAAEGGQAADGSKGHAWNGTVKYANGPINAGYSYWQNNEEGGNGALASTAGSDQRSSRVWARYAFPMGLALGIGFDSSKYDNNVGTATNWVSRNAWLVTGQYTMGANAFYLQYAKAGNTSGTAAADTGSGAKAWMLAYDYALSKRTSIGISYTDLKNDATNGTYDFASTPVATPVGAKSSQLHLGMSHKF
jgi:predicted porin